MLRHVREHHGDLLNTEEAAHVEALLAASVPAQRLFARLLTRKGPWVRIDKLDYAEVHDRPAALQALEEARLVVLNVPAPADVLLGLLTHEERSTLVPTIGAQGKAR